jgi:GT2 family glycosyltransferase
MTRSQETDPLFDILIVSYNTRELLFNCLQSIRAECSLPYRVVVWDNGSTDGTRERVSDCRWEGFDFHWHHDNAGFIGPNNELARRGRASYVCMLNSDTVVKRGWDLALAGALNIFPQVGAVGMSGGRLSEAGEGKALFCSGAPYGEVDYVEGWCLCLRRETIDTHLAGVLLDEANLTLAYFEDADLCLRVKESGMGLLVLPNGDEKNGKWVTHLRAQTALKVAASSERERLAGAFEANHVYFRRRWSEYLKRKSAGACQP